MLSNVLTVPLDVPFSRYNTLDLPIGPIHRTIQIERLSRAIAFLLARLQLGNSSPSYCLLVDITLFSPLHSTNACHSSIGAQKCCSRGV